MEETPTIMDYVIASDVNQQFQNRNKKIEYWFAYQKKKKKKRTFLTQLFQCVGLDFLIFN